jgi:hypothetical protein
MSVHEHYRVSIVEDDIRILREELDSLKAERKQYKIVHKSAKAIVCILITLIIYLTGGSLYANMLIIPIWFFGVNFTAYILETLLGHRHCHEVI